MAATASNLRQSPVARRVLQALFVVLMLSFFGLALFSQLPRVLSYNWVFDGRYLTLAVVLMVLRGPVVVYGWWSTMRLLGYPIPFPKAMRIGYHSALARYIPGQMWYAVSRVYLAEKEGVPRMVTAVSVGIETALLVVAAGLVSTLSLIVWRDAPLWAIGIAFVALVIVVLHPRHIFRSLNWGMARLGRKPLDVELSRRDMLWLLVPFVIGWLHYGLMSFALTAALYPELPWSQLPALTGLYTAAWLIGFLTVIVPQGFFVREGLVFAFLTGFMGIPAAVATAAAVLSRAWTMLAEGFWALVTTRFK